MSVLSFNFVSPLLYYLLKIPYMLTHGGHGGNLGIVIYALSFEAQLGF